MAPNPSSGSRPPNHRSNDVVVESMTIKLSPGKLAEFRNLLAPQYRERRDMTKRYRVTVPFRKDQPVTPERLKQLVLASGRIQLLLDEVQKERKGFAN